MACLFSFEDGMLKCHHNLDMQLKKTPPMHTHNYIELYYFISGKCCCLVEGTEYWLQPRDILVIRPMEAHTMRWYEGIPYERIGIQLPLESLKEIDPSGELIKPMMERPLGTDNRFTDEDFGHRFCADALHSIGEGITAAGLLARAALILSEINRTFPARKIRPRSTDLGVQIIDFVNQELYTAINMERVCREFYISRSQLSRIFKQYTGASFWQYITVKRMNAAHRRIHAGEPPTLVADQCGYSEYSTFYRAYIKHFGHSPKLSK